MWPPYELGSRRHYAVGIITGVVIAAIVTFVDGLDGHEAGFPWLAIVVVVCAGLSGPVMATVRRRRNQRGNLDR